MGEHDCGLPLRCIEVWCAHYMLLEKAYCPLERDNTEMISIYHFHKSVSDAAEYQPSSHVNLQIRSFVLCFIPYDSSVRNMI